MSSWKPGPFSFLSDISPRRASYQCTAILQHSFETVIKVVAEKRNSQAELNAKVEEEVDGDGRRRA